MRLMKNQDISTIPNPIQHARVATAAFWLCLFSWIVMGILFLVVDRALTWLSAGLLLITAGGILVSMILAIIALFNSNRSKSYAHWSLLLNVILSIGTGLALPKLQGACCGSSLESVKRNMHAIQLGVETYAGDHNGDYPDSLFDPNFKWSQTIPPNPKNPYNENMVGVQMVEENINTSGKAKTAFEMATKDDRPFRGPGMIRYYIDRRDHSTYALTGSDKEGRPIKVKYVQKETADGWVNVPVRDASNYTLDTEHQR